MWILLFVGLTMYALIGKGNADFFRIKTFKIFIYTDACGCRCK